MPKRGDTVLYSKAAWPTAHSYTFCFFGVIEEVVSVQGWERYVVVGALGERVIAALDELTVKKHPDHGVPKPEPYRRRY